MTWPSQNVPYGGILHPAKATYSPATHQFLKVLMDESKLTMFQRKKMDYCLRNGESLPPPSDYFKKPKRFSQTLLGSEPPRTIRPGQSKRRTRDTIVGSGAYEQERYINVKPTVNRELEKQKLQNRMAFGKAEEKGKGSGDGRKKERKLDLPPEMNRFDQLVMEIKEREEFLDAMVQLGQGEKHRLVIEQQIQARVRELKSLKLENSPL